ncbi:hypothetical protein HF086_006145 [Spodoptera exigua]|uniref:EF-hand domain-containing protein n=1 Tax=Spodoptera exigua TaxID=7107 RepID=A0A922SND2_SPOEX|nr:hypothetical protein HF086_006145 [Spodoptera exigua]
MIKKAMGSSQSFPGLTEDVLEDYTSLTYLTKGEILYLMKKFYSIDPEKVKKDFHHRFNREEILTKFHVLENNPFLDRIFSVFSSKGDGCLSFEDLVDLCSAMSYECPAEVKAAWAFRIFGRQTIFFFCVTAYPAFHFVNTNVDSA